MTYEERMKMILEAYKNGEIDAAAVLEKIQNAGCEDMGFANIDHARSFRQGFPEVVYCEGKTPEQNAAIMATWHETTTTFSEQGPAARFSVQSKNRCGTPSITKWQG